MAVDLDMPLLSSLPEYGTSIQDSLISSANLTRSGTWENGRLYQRRNSVRRICESDCLLLPTPTTYAESLRPGVRPAGTNKLERRLRRYPTPEASDIRDTPQRLPTPTANNGWAARGRGRDRNRRLTTQLAIAPEESVNPAVWGWMMGFPPGYAESILMPPGTVPLPKAQESQASESREDVSASAFTGGQSRQSRQPFHSGESSTSILCSELQVGDRAIYQLTPILGEIVEIDRSRSDPYKIEYCNNTSAWYSLDQILAGRAHPLPQATDSDPLFEGVYRRATDSEPKVGDCLFWFATAISWGLVVEISANPRRKKPYRVLYCGGQVQCHKPAELGIGQGMSIYRPLNLSVIEGGSYDSSSGRDRG